MCRWDRIRGRRPSRRSIWPRSANATGVAGTRASARFRSMLPRAKRLGGRRSRLSKSCGPACGRRRGNALLEGLAGGKTGRLLAIVGVANHGGLVGTEYAAFTFADRRKRNQLIALHPSSSAPIGGENVAACRPTRQIIVDQHCPVWTGSIVARTAGIGQRTGVADILVGGRVGDFCGVERTEGCGGRGLLIRTLRVLDAGSETPRKIGVSQGNAKHGGQTHSDATLPPRTSWCK